MIFFLETLHEHALLVDTAMCLLIWIVQLVIYPSFRFIATDDFKIWHRKYCNRISFFVLPVMTLQLLESSSSCFFEGDILHWAKLSAVSLAWLVTFVHSAKMHRTLSNEGKSLKTIDCLIKWNWQRTFLWSISFICSVLLY